MKRSGKKKQSDLSSVTRFRNPVSETEKDIFQTGLDGLHLEHFWQSADDPNEVIFVLRTKDLKMAKQFIKKNNSRNREESKNTIQSSLKENRV